MIERIKINGDVLNQLNFDFSDTLIQQAFTNPKFNKEFDKSN